MAAWNLWALEDSSLYSMDGVKKALMLCVETKNPGAPRDMDIMKRFCKKFGFDYEIKREPNAESMLMSLQNLAFNMNYSPNLVSCILITFSGHGCEYIGDWNETVLCCADNQLVKVSSITSIFSEENCPRLKGVPKIFIIDACRGRIEDFGVMHGSSSKYNWGQTRQTHWSVVPHAETPGYWPKYDEDGIREYRSRYRSAVINDMFAAYASSPGNPAYMDEVAGGYLFFCIERVFLDQSTKGIHFMDLFLRVKQCMENINSIRDVDQALLTMNMESTLSQLLYLG